MAGGVATLAIDYYQLGEQTGEMAGDILSGKTKPQTMPIQLQKSFKVIINKENAEKSVSRFPKICLRQQKALNKQARVSPCFRGETRFTDISQEEDR